jgi:ABC-type sugar transport system ATPase subunit
MTTAPSAVLAARAVSKRFSGTTALADVDFAVQQGHVHALIGENGAGKSTLVKILAGVEQPTSGAVLFDGETVHFTSPREARRVGIDIIHQELQLFPDLSIEENLFVGRERRTRWGTIDRTAQREAAAAVLHRLGRHLDMDRRVGSLPLGQQQIVEIARAVVHDTRALMMDEPTRGVDVAAKGEIVDTMRRLAAEGIAVVFATSDLAEIEAAATRAVVMARGRITADLSGPEMTTEALAAAASATPVREGGGDA